MTAATLDRVTRLVREVRRTLRVSAAGLHFDAGPEVDDSVWLRWSDGERAARTRLHLSDSDYELVAQIGRGIRGWRAEGPAAAGGALA